jgi:hypothetical protein
MREVSKDHRIGCGKAETIDREREKNKIVDKKKPTRSSGNKA